MTTGVFFVALLFGTLLLMTSNRSSNSGGSSALPVILVGLAILILLAGK